MQLYALSPFLIVPCLVTPNYTSSVDGVVFFWLQGQVQSLKVGSDTLHVDSSLSLSHPSYDIPPMLHCNVPDLASLPVELHWCPSDAQTVSVAFF